MTIGKGETQELFLQRSCFFLKESVKVRATQSAQSNETARVLRNERAISESLGVKQLEAEREQSKAAL